MPEANLCKGMRRVNGVYTQGTNRRHVLIGHLFQGRFKAILVERDTYLLEFAASAASSHKPNTAFAQAFYNKAEGVNRITTETGAGQWASSLPLAGSFVGFEIVVFMVRVRFDGKPYRRAYIETLGAECIASPSDRTASVEQILTGYASPDGPIPASAGESGCEWHGVMLLWAYPRERGGIRA